MSHAVRLYHTTSPASACRIILSGRFVPDAMPADRGLNAFPDDRHSQQELSGRGAMLVMEWTGPVRAGPQIDLPDVLVDQMPHRMFVAAGTRRHLRLIGLRMSEPGWLEAVHGIHPLPSWVRLMGLGGFHRRGKLRLLKSRIASRLLDHPAIEVEASRFTP